MFDKWFFFFREIYNDTFLFIFISVSGGAVGRMWSMATRSDSAEGTTPTVSVNNFALPSSSTHPNQKKSIYHISFVLYCVYLLRPDIVTAHHNIICLMFLQPIRTLWRQFSTGWRAAPPSWSVRPGRLTCLSSGICSRKTATEEKRWVDKKKKMLKLCS